MARPVLNLLSASVAKNQHFRPCRKNYGLDRIMIATYCHDVLYRHAKFGEIELRAPAVGAKIVFVCHAWSACMRVHGEHKSNKYCLMIYGSILMLFSALFQNRLFFWMHYIVLIFVATCISRNCGQKLRKVQKSAEKFVRTIVLISERFEEKSTAVV